MKLPVKYNDFHYTERWKIRNEYICVQKGLCYHCKKPLEGEPAKHVRDMAVKKHLFPNGFFTHPIHLHHSHKTGLTIGAVHNYCNAVLWQYHGE